MEVEGQIKPALSQGSPLITRTPKKQAPNTPARNVLGSVWNNVKNQVAQLSSQVLALRGPFFDERTHCGIGEGATCTVDRSNDEVIRKVSLSRCMLGKNEQYFYRILPLCQKSTATRASVVAAEVLAEVTFTTRVRGYPNFVQLIRWNFANMGDDIRFYFAFPYYATALGDTEIAVSELACGISNALAHMHDDLKVSHRDVKPDNILKLREPRSHADATGRYVLSDFGCVAPLGSASGNQLGTPAFYPPNGESRFTAEADVYALGLSICVLLFGAKVLQNKMSIGHFLGTCSAACQEFVMACLNPVEQRLTARELCDLEFASVWQQFDIEEKDAGSSTDDRAETKLASFTCSPQRRRIISSSIHASPASVVKTELMAYVPSPPSTGSSRIQRRTEDLSSPYGRVAVRLFASPSSESDHAVPEMSSLPGFSLPQSGLKRKASLLEEDDSDAEL